MSMQPPVDLIVVGGGINGAGIARDAAGRGLKTVLCEKDDLASHTSSASSKLIHGGLRYLEYYEFQLVRKSLEEREVLLRAAPHVIWPLRFVMPYDKSLRPAWLIRIGLLLYDHLDFGKRKLLPGSQGIKLGEHPAGAPLRARFKKGFVYSDAWVHDSRLVVLNAIDAAERGAEILTRTRCVSAKQAHGHWVATLRSEIDGTTREVEARCLVNATGPWVCDFLQEAAQRDSGHNIRQVKGSHIVVPKLFDHGFAYIFQNTDQRMIFALPYEDDYILIGTTDMEYQGDPGAVAINDEEIAYLCEASNRYFRRKIGAQDVVWAYSGVRPLLDDKEGDAAAVTRDYTLEVHTDGAPLLNVFGGKITTYRKLAEEAVDMLKPVLNFEAPAWTGKDAPLPGGDIANADFFKGFLPELQRRYPWLPSQLARRYACAYGTRTDVFLAGTKQLEDLGEHLGDGVYAAELRYLLEHEWAGTSEDILWRRSKLGLHVSQETVQRLEDWIDGALQERGPRGRNTLTYNRTRALPTAGAAGTKMEETPR